MKNIVYVTLKDFSLGNADGVVKKINNQIECFRKSGFSVDLVCINEKQKSVMLINADGEREIAEFKRFSGIFGAKEIAKYLKDKNYDAAYIRYFGRTDPWFLDVLKTLKKNNVKILVELPTYPYDKSKKWWDLIIDKLYRGKLKKYTERIVTFSEDVEIFNVPTLKTINGVAIDDIVPAVFADHPNNEIHFVAIALFQQYHGYERILKSLSEYIKNSGERQIYFHFVGNGPERKKYEQIVNDNNLNEYVKFYGKKSGKELDDMYNLADIALGTFGMYKIGLTISSNLKVRSYLAKGIPFVSACKEDILVDKDIDFYFNVNNDSSDIDMDSIINWYLKIIDKYKSKQELQIRIRDFAKRSIDMPIAMKSVIDYINEM